MPRRLPSLIALLWLINLLFPAALAAQSDDDLAALDAPTAYEREIAALKLDDARLLAHYRKLLDQGAGAVQLITALERIQQEKKPEDIRLIVKYIGDLDPDVAQAAMDALRTFGRDALPAVEGLPASQVDARTRKEVIERLLKDHIYYCCQRDTAINPFQLDFEDRFLELYSVSQELDELMFRMLRDSLADIREDINGTRYYYWGMTSYDVPFTDYGGLAIAALAKRHPERLMKEAGELAEVESNTDIYYWGNANRSPVTLALAIFFAQQGKTALVDKVINDMESGSRWMQANQTLGLHVRVAAIQFVALGEYEAALERLNEHLKQAGSALSSTVSQAHYLRARMLMHLKEEGAALHALEESMESSGTAMVLTLVDSHFKPLAGERRFQAVLDYCKLAARRLDEGQRPYQPAPDKQE